MTYEELIAAMTPEMHGALKQAIEIGKWPNGQRLSNEQRDICMRAVITYEHKQQLPDAERTGFIDRTKKDGSQHGEDPLAPQTIKILTNS